MLSQITTIDALVPLEVSAQADRLARAKQRQAAAAAAAAQASSSASKTALVSVAGGLTPRGSWSGSSLTGIAAQVTRAADDHDVAGIILDVDSPGGTVSATRPQLRSPWRRQRNLHRGREYARGLGGVLDCLAGRRAGDYAVRRRRLDWRHHHAPGYFRLARPGGDQDGDRSFRESPNKNEAHPLRTRLEPICKAGQTRLAPISSRRSRAAVASRRPRSARNSVRAAWSARARPLRAAWRTGSQPSIRSSAACCSDARRGRARAVDRSWRSIDRLILEQQFYSPALFRD